MGKATTKRITLNEKDSGTHFLDISIDENNIVKKAKDHKNNDAVFGELLDANFTLTLTDKKNGKVHDIVKVSDGAIIECKGSSYYFYFLNGRWYRVYVP